MKFTNKGVNKASPVDRQFPGGTSNPHSKQKINMGGMVVKAPKSNLMTGNSSNRPKGHI